MTLNQFDVCSFNAPSPLWWFEWQSRPRSGINLRTGFTLVELLVVLSVIAVLTSLLLPALNTAKAKGQRMGCLSNLRQFGIAFQLYAVDQQDAVFPNRDGKLVPLGQTWVEGWLGVPGSDCTNVIFLKRSLASPYIQGLRVWRCPASKDPTVGGITMPRVRTVSLNCFMGSQTNTSKVLSYLRLQQIVRPSPSETLAFLDERIDTINDGSFAMQWDFDQEQADSWVLRDKPSVVHNDGAILTFADGHVVLHRWKDARTLSAPRDDSLMPRNLDVMWLEEHGTWRQP